MAEKEYKLNVFFTNKKTFVIPQMSLNAEENME